MNQQANELNNNCFESSTAAKEKKNNACSKADTLTLSFSVTLPLRLGQCSRAKSLLLIYHLVTCHIIRKELFLFGTLTTESA